MSYIPYILGGLAIGALGAAPACLYFYGVVKDLRIQVQAREDIARDYFEENERLMRIMAGNRETRRAATSQARRLVGRA